MTDVETEKRVITSHKGGRTARLECRITPRHKQLLDELKKKHGLTGADLVELWIEEQAKAELQNS